MPFGGKIFMCPCHTRNGRKQHLDTATGVDSSLVSGLSSVDAFVKRLDRVNSEVPGYPCRSPLVRARAKKKAHTRIILLVCGFWGMRSHSFVGRFVTGHSR